jgi:hypothetical protein
MAEAMSTALPPNDLLNSLLREMNSSDPELTAWKSVVNNVKASEQLNAVQNDHDNEERHRHSRSRTASIMVPTASMQGSASYETPPLLTTMTTTKTRAKPELDPKPKPPQHRASPVNKIKIVGSHAAADPIMPKACKASSQKMTTPAVPMPVPTLPLAAKVPTKARTKLGAKAVITEVATLKLSTAALDMVQLMPQPVRSGVDKPTVKTTPIVKPTPIVEPTPTEEPLAVDTYSRKVRPQEESGESGYV